MRLVHPSYEVSWTLLLVLTFYQANAQQSILLNQSSYNLFSSNPAALGLNSSLNINAHYKKNWIGLSDSPEALQLTIDGQIPKKNFGLGLNIFQENAGISSKSSVYGAFNYKLQFSKEHFFYFGLAIGFQKIQNDFSKIKADRPEEFAQWPQQQAVTKPDASFGLIYTYKKIVLGASVTQILHQDYVFKEPVYNVGVSYSRISHFILSFHYTIDIEKNKWQMIPQICLRSPQGLGTQFDFLNTIVYKEKLFVGLGYRKNYALYSNLGVSVSDKLRIMYSYEYSLGIQTYTKGGHEIGIKYSISESRFDRKSSLPINSNETIESVYQEIDSQNQNIEGLTKRIDSLDRNIQLLKEQITQLKNEQIEITKNDFQFLNETTETNNSLSSQRTKNLTKVKQTETYKKFDLSDDTNKSLLKDSLVSEYQIVLGVYQLLNYAKEYQKFLKRELNFETSLIELPNHPKKYIYVCLAIKHPLLETALKELENTNEITHSKSIEITKGDAWILQTKNR